MTHTARPALLVAFDDVLANTAAERGSALCEAMREVAGSSVSRDALQWSAWCEGRTFAAAARDAVRHAASETANPANPANTANTGVTADDEPAIALVALLAERHFSARAQRGLALHDGAAAFVRAAAAHAPLGLIAWSARRDVAATIAFAGIEDAFTFVITADDAADDAPPAARWALGVTRLRTRARHTVISALVGGHTAIHGARAAGATAVAVGALPTETAFLADRWVPALDATHADDVLALTRRPELP
ncbi:MAG: hypothetical protein NTZ43_11255 [Gemmatimonadetes bacterium]|nr:hypothetical protein [Gemmatimonadota bacterium]